MYSSRRTRIRNRRIRTRGGSTSAPIVAFLLIASFGILFAGCNRTVRGPNDPESAVLEDTTFTAEDLARFQELADGSESGVVTGSGSSEGDIARLDIADSSSGTVAGPTIDPALASKYLAVRAMPDTGATNVYRVTNEFLNVRAEANVKAASVGRLNQGELMTLVEFVNAGWAKIQMANGTQGFVASRYIAKLVSESRLKDEEKNFEGLYFVDYTFVNVRKSPDQQSEKLGEIPGQAFVRPISVDKLWARVPFQGKEGYVSTQFLAPFRPTFLVRQDTFTLPILRYDVSQPGMLEAMVAHATKLREGGAKLMTFRSFFDLVLTQELRDVRLAPKSVLLGVTGLTPANVKQVSDALYAAAVPATLFLQTKDVGVSGISEKTILTLQANGFDIQSEGHTGDDLRALTNAQMMLELQQSRMLLEEMTGKTVFAVFYPQGGVNERVMQKAVDAGYLFGVGSMPDRSFTRDQFLRLPSVAVTSTMTADDVVQFVK